MKPKRIAYRWEGTTIRKLDENGREILHDKGRNKRIRGHKQRKNRDDAETL